MSADFEKWQFAAVCKGLEVSNLIQVPEHIFLPYFGYIVNRPFCSCFVPNCIKFGNLRRRIPGFAKLRPGKQVFAKLRPGKHVCPIVDFFHLCHYILKRVCSHLSIRSIISLVILYFDSIIFNTLCRNICSSTFVLMMSVTVSIPFA